MPACVHDGVCSLSRRVILSRDMQARYLAHTAGFSYQPWQAGTTTKPDWYCNVCLWHQLQQPKHLQPGGQLTCTFRSATTSASFAAEATSASSNRLRHCK
jgi:hypothetical protein